MAHATHQQVKLGTSGAGAPRTTEQTPQRMRAAGALALALAAVLVVLRQPHATAPAWVILLGGGAIAVALQGSWGNGRFVVAWWQALSLGVVSFFASATVVGSVAAVVGVPVWSNRLSASLTVAVVLGAFVAVANRRSGSAFAPRQAADLPALIAGGALWILGAAWTLLVPLSSWSHFVSSGTDFMRHVHFVQGFGDQGNLSYSSNSYPGGLHATTALAMGGGADFATAWQGLEITVWLVFCVLVLAAVGLAVSVGRRIGVDRRAVDATVAIAVVAVLLQSMWITSMLSSGSATSILAGMVLATALGLVLASEGPASSHLLVALAMSAMLLVHTWTLLVPVLALPVIIVAVGVLRSPVDRPKAMQWFILIVLAAVSLFGVSGIFLGTARVGGVVGAISIAGSLGEGPPGAVSFLVVVVLAVVAWRRLRNSGSGWFAICWLGMLEAGIATFLVLFIATAGPSQGWSYYPLKTLWSLSILVLPLAVAGAVWLLVAAWRRLAVGRLSLGVQRGCIVGMAAIAAALAVWPLVAPSSVSTLGNLAGAANRAPLELPVIDSLRAMGVAPAERTLVVAIAPGWQRWQEQFDDRVVEETLAAPAHADEALEAAKLREPQQICERLREHPDTLRITGDRAAAIQQLESAGCPTAVIRPDTWVSVPIAREWLLSAW